MLLVYRVSFSFTYLFTLYFNKNDILVTRNTKSVTGKLEIKTIYKRCCKNRFIYICNFSFDCGNFIFNL